jgi:hypothetical protein
MQSQLFVELVVHALFGILQLGNLINVHYILLPSFSHEPTCVERAAHTHTHIHSHCVVTVGFGVRLRAWYHTQLVRCDRQYQGQCKIGKRQVPRTNQKQSAGISNKIGKRREATAEAAFDAIVPCSTHNVDD